MSIITSFSNVIAFASASLVVAGCATQTAAFRRMTAEDHERASTKATDPVAAEAHVTAAKDLRRAEQAACYEIPDVDRDEGPFGRRDRIAGVEILRERVYPKAPKQLAGVVVYIRATAGATEQWLGRVIECHLAHRAVVGARLAQQTCPLDTDARISVSSTATGFRVAITSQDLDVARSVIDKCQALAN